MYLFQSLLIDNAYIMRSEPVMILYLMLFIVIFSLFMALKHKRPLFLLLPFVSIFGYFIFEIIRFPAPLGETIRFIFNLG